VLAIACLLGTGTGIGFAALESNAVAETAGTELLYIRGRRGLWNSIPTLDEVDQHRKQVELRNLRR
jgi:hypothetical protein